MFLVTQARDDSNDDEQNHLSLSSLFFLFVTNRLTLKWSKLTDHSPRIL